MKPLDPPLLAEPPDPLPEMAHQAMRDATVTLWRDLWAKAETADQLRAENESLRAELEATKVRARRLARERGQLAKQLGKRDWDRRVIDTTRGPAR